MSIVNDNMSDTPETDAQGFGDGRHPWVATDFARKLERERDELQKAVNGLCEHFKVSPANTTLLAVELLKIQRERDEALEKIKQQKLEIVRLNGATNHAGGTPLKIALRERDEAAEKHRSAVIYWQIDVFKMQRARDEAREALEYIAHSGLSARHIEDYAKEFLSKK